MINNSLVSESQLGLPLTQPNKMVAVDSMAVPIAIAYTSGLDYGT